MNKTAKQSTRSARSLSEAQKTLLNILARELVAEHIRQHQQKGNAS